MSEEVTTEPVVEPKNNDKLDALMTKLGELGITEVEQLENKAKAASQTGNLANLLGETRRQVAELEAKLAAVTTPPEHASPRETEYDDNGVDIDAAIGNAVDKALDRRAENARKVQAARAKEAQAIRTNEHYKVVERDFEKYMISPQAQARLSTGESPTKIFNDMVAITYRKMLQETAAAAKAAQGDPSATAIPYVESDQTPPPVRTGADEKQTEIKKLRENWSGTDDDVTKALNALLPSGSLLMPNR